jgi:hypothetical protein
MADEIVPAGETGVQVVDSLMANEFEVEIEGESVNGVFKVSGFIPFKLEVKPTNALKLLYDPFKISKMVQRDPNLPFNRWVQETINAGSDLVRPTRTLTLVAVDDGMPVRRWVVKDAWITEIAYSDFNSSAGELVEETLTIRYESVEASWGAE